MVDLRFGYHAGARPHPGAAVRPAAGHIVLVLLFATACQTGDEVPEPSAAERTPVPQEATERVFPTGELTVIDTVRVDDDTFWPVKLVVLNSGELLVADKASTQVVRLSADGEILARYGSGVGAGPGEHKGIDGLGQLSDGTVWTWDILNLRVNLFNDDGSFRATWNPETGVRAVAVLTTDKMIGVDMKHPTPFVAFDAEGSITDRWGWFVDEPTFNSLPFIGESLRLEDGSGIVYVPQFAARLYSYNADGSLRWHRSVIDPVDLPKVSYDGMDFGEDGPQLLQHTLNVSDEHFHIQAITGNYQNFYLDTYDAASGDYLHSLSYVPGMGCAPLFVGSDVFFMSCSAQIVRFRIPER